MSEAWRVVGGPIIAAVRYYKAEDAYLHALDLEARSAAPGGTCSKASPGLGAAYQGAGNYKRAEEAYRAARAILEATGFDACVRHFCTSTWARCSRAEGCYPERELALRQGLAGIQQDGACDDTAEAYLPQ